MDLNLLKRAFYYGQSLLQNLVRGHLQNVRQLYRYGARREDCFIIAAREGHMHLLQFFLNAGFNVHAKNELALRVAARGGHLQVVEFLLRHGANLHAEGELAFRWAAMNGHLHVVQHLHQCGAQNIGLALRWAAANGHLHIIVYLHQFGGADLNAENNVALRLACRGRYSEVIKYLYSAVYNVA